MQKLFLGLLAFAPIALFAAYFGAPPIAVFFLCILGIVPLAKFIGEATEQIAEHTDPAFGGFLNASFGNATELIVGFFALKSGLLDVVRATIAGSIIGNLLLAIGLSMFIGGLRHKKQTFNRAGISAMGITLLLSSIALIVPSVFVQTVPSAAHSIEPVSVFVSIALLIAYGCSLFFSLRTHKDLYISDIEPSDPRWGKGESIAILCVATLLVAWVSDVMVDAITPVVSSIGWSPVFISIVFVAIAGNAAEYASAITAAVKDRMDLALQISMGSAIQIAQFVAPILVLLSLLFATQLSLVFGTFELVAIVFSTVIINFVVLDGESNWLEGAQLVIAYAIIACAFFFYF